MERPNYNPISSHINIILRAKYGRSRFWQEWFYPDKRFKKRTMSREHPAYSFIKTYGRWQRFHKNEICVIFWQAHKGENTLKAHFRAGVG
jgi:hypothetical protein